MIKGAVKTYNFKVSNASVIQLVHPLFSGYHFIIRQKRYLFVLCTSLEVGKLNTFEGFYITHVLYSILGLLVVLSLGRHFLFCFYNQLLNHKVMLMS